MGLSFFTLFEIYLHSAFERCKVLNSHSVSTEFRGWEIPAHGWIFNEIQPIARFHCAASNFASCTSIGHFTETSSVELAIQSLEIHCGSIVLGKWHCYRHPSQLGTVRGHSTRWDL